MNLPLTRATMIHLPSAVEVRQRDLMSRTVALDTDEPLTRPEAVDATAKLITLLQDGVYLAYAAAHYGPAGFGTGPSSAMVWRLWLGGHRFADALDRLCALATICPPLVADWDRVFADNTLGLVNTSLGPEVLETWLEETWAPVENESDGRVRANIAGQQSRDRYVVLLETQWGPENATIINVVGFAEIPPYRPVDYLALVDEETKAALRLATQLDAFAVPHFHTLRRQWRTQAEWAQWRTGKRDDPRRSTDVGVAGAIAALTGLWERLSRVGGGDDCRCAECGVGGATLRCGACFGTFFCSEACRNAGTARSWNHLCSTTRFLSHVLAYQMSALRPSVWSVIPAIELGV
jgi:hypothetical protein